jgi:hypothetical protein
LTDAFTIYKRAIRRAKVDAKPFSSLKKKASVKTAQVMVRLKRQIVLWIAAN